MERRLKKQEEIPTQIEGKSIVFFHPDLGIGGAERLVVDAAVGLQNLGHKVTILTSYRDLHHCFDEARDGTLDVRVRGGWLFPATLLGRFKILCSILRQIHLILAITWSGELAKLRPTAFFVDQLSAGVPFLRWFWEDQKILFYCHFPDLLLAQGRKRWHRKIWRIIFDWWEGWGIRGADRVIVNSGFTKGVAETVWPGLGGERGVGVVYPCVDTSEPHNIMADGQADVQALWKGKKVLLSINRFERKKNIGLAIKAFAGLKSKEREGVRLVIAGMALISRGYLHFHERTLTPEKVATTPGKKRT
jgi:alpha-1,3/alpha-1,6-mannosyltransferase